MREIDDLMVQFKNLERKRKNLEQERNAGLDRLTASQVYGYKCFGAQSAK